VRIIVGGEKPLGQNQLGDIFIIVDANNFMILDGCYRRVSLKIDYIRETILEPFSILRF